MKRLRILPGGTSTREGSALERLQAQVKDLAQQVARQPSAKDLRELRQAVRSLSRQSNEDDKRMFEALDRMASSTQSVVLGPWTGEVGFELLYWIPFLEWVRAQWNIRPRELVISRGGVESWYGTAPSAYAETFSVVTTEEFRAAIAQEKRKQHRMGAFDDRILGAVLRQRELAHAEVLHPGMMYRAFAPYWNDEAGYARIDQFTRHRLLDPPAAERPEGLPHEYVAVRFYFSESFPATAENQAFARSTIASLAERIPVVLLNPGFSVDEHDDVAPSASGRIFTIGDSMTPIRNLAVQSAVIAGARAFVGTYGGYSYLAPLYRVPAIAFYSRRTFKSHHLHAAERAFEGIGAAPLIPLDVAQANLVQLALGALAAT